MPQVIKLKNSTVAGSVPVIGDLILGELATNSRDGKVYTKHKDPSDTEKIILLNEDIRGGRRWNSSVEYKAGDIVSYALDSRLYIATIDNQGSDPSWLMAWYEFNTPRHNAGMWTPSAGNEYPDYSLETSGAVWYVNGLPPYAPPPAPQGGYVMLTGPFTGIHVSNNDRFVWYGKNAMGTDIWLHEQAPDFVTEKGGIAFSAQTYYIKGDIVSYNDKQYMAPGNIPSAAWDVSLWNPIYSEKGGIIYDPSIQYQSGDIISYNGVVYVAPTPSPAAGTAPGSPGWPLVSSERGGIMWAAGQKYAIGDSVWDNANGPAALYACTNGHTATTGNGANGSPQQIAAVNWTPDVTEDPGVF